MTPSRCDSHNRIMHVVHLHVPMHSPASHRLAGRFFAFFCLYLRPQTTYCTLSALHSASDFNNEE